MVRAGGVSVLGSGIGGSWLRLASLSSSDHRPSSSSLSRDKESKQPAQCSAQLSTLCSEGGTLLGLKLARRILPGLNSLSR